MILYITSGFTYGSEDEHLVRLKMIYIPICGSFVDIVAHMR